MRKECIETCCWTSLDIGVGAGRITLYLQEKGLEVVGVDISDLALDVGRRRGVCNLARMSACSLAFETNSFDSAIAFGNGFGLCGSPSRIEIMLKRLHKVLTAEGVILAESIDPLRTDNPTHIEYHQANVARNRLPGQVALRYRYKQLVSDWFEVLLATPEQMESICKRAGWKIAEIYGSVGPRIYRSLESCASSAPAVYVGVLTKA